MANEVTSAGSAIQRRLPDQAQHRHFPCDPTLNYGPVRLGPLNFPSYIHRRLRPARRHGIARPNPTPARSLTSRRRTSRLLVPESRQARPPPLLAQRWHLPPTLRPLPAAVRLRRPPKIQTLDNLRMTPATST